MSDPLIHPNPTAQDVLKKVIDWASRRCPADDESVPCPLCGARADVPGDACKAVESIFPRELLRELRSVLAVESTPPSPQVVGWPIATDDQVEALAKECGWRNRSYMTTGDYSIWCDQMRTFARLASQPKPAPGSVTVEFCEKIIAEMGRIIGDLQAELDKGKTP